MPAAYRINLDNVVAMTGRGTSYQVEIHVDSPQGPLLYQGARITDGNRFNAEDLSRLDATRFLTQAHLGQGFIDLFVTATVEGDTWTTYRDHDGTPRDLFALVPDPARFAAWQRLQEERAALAERGVFLLPHPQRLELRPADFALMEGTAIATAGTADPAVTHAAHLLATDIGERAGVRVAVQEGTQPNEVRLTLATAAGEALPEETGPQAYVVDVGAGRAEVLARTPQGLFYGVQTLCQLLGRRDGKPVIHGVRIEDWPDLPNRMVQYDIARGNTVNVEYWKRWIRELSRLKINQIMLYMEDDYHFAKYPFLGRPDTFTPAKARELVDYARDYYVELVPQIESLGHAGALLSHEELKGLRLGGDAGAISPCAERTLRVLDDLFGELADAFPQSALFHVGGDEVWGFANDPRCAAMVGEVGEEGVYAFHLNNLQQLLAKRNRTVAFWGDEVLAFPKVADSLTREAVVFDWHYGDQAAYPSIQFFQERGFSRIYVCPAVHGYFDVYPQYRLAFRNIAGFIRAGVERQVEGACCTTWGMNVGGNAENYLYGLAYAAQCAWNSRETERTDFDDRFAAAWLGIAGAKGAREDIDRAFWFAWRGEARAPFWQQLFETSRLLFAGPDEVLAKRDPEQRERLAQEAAALEALCAEATDAIARLRAGSTRNQATLDALQHAVNCHRHVAAKLAALCVLWRDYRAAYAATPRQPQVLADALGAALAALGAVRAEFPTLEAGFRDGIDTRGGDPDDLKRLQTAREALDAILTRLTQARADLAQDKPPIDPASLGLGWRLEQRVGGWQTRDINPSARDNPRRLVFEVTQAMAAPGTYEVEWDYTAGEDGLDILSTSLCQSSSREALPQDLHPVVADEHPAFTGAADRNHRYRLTVPALPPDPARRLFVVGTVYNQRTFNTAGDVWLRQGWGE
jgi:hypothetical protein